MCNVFTRRRHQQELAHSRVSSYHRNTKFLLSLTQSNRSFLASTKCMERMIIVTIKWLFNNYTNPTSAGREFWLKKNEEQIQKMAKWKWKSMWNNIAKRIAQVSDLTVFTVKRFWVKKTSGASKVHTYFLIFLSSLSPARKNFVNDVT